MLKKIIFTLFLFFGSLFAQVPDQNEFFNSEKYFACNIALPEKDEWCKWFASFQFLPNETYTENDFNNMLLLDKNKNSNFYPIELVLQSIMNTNTDLAIKLIKAGADLHEKGESYEFLPYPIFAAIDLNNIDVLTVLIEYKAKLDVQNEMQASPLVFASYNEKQNEIATYLLDVINNTTDPKYLLDMQDYQGMSALYYASQWEDKEFAHALIDSGVNINLINTEGNSLIMLAAKHSHDNEKLFECIDFLLQQDNIDINHLNDNNENILFQLFYGPYDQDTLNIKEKTNNLIELLINDYEVNIKQTNKKGESILFKLVREENTELFNLFLDKGLDINITNHAKENLLMIAVEIKSKAMIGFLLDKNIKNHHQKQALTYASDLAKNNSRYTEIENYLRAKMQ